MRTSATAMATVSNIATIADGFGRRRQRSRWQVPVARVGIVVGAILIAAVVLRSSLASWADVDHPQLAARIAPWNATAAADAAASLGSNPRSPRVRSLVRRALGRDLKGKTSPVLYLAGIVAAFFSRHDLDVAVWIALAFFVAVAVLWLVPDRRIERVLLEERPAGS